MPKALAKLFKKPLTLKEVYDPALHFFASSSKTISLIFNGMNNLLFPNTIQWLL